MNTNALVLEMGIIYLVPLNALAKTRLYRPYSAASSSFSEA